MRYLYINKLRIKAPREDEDGFDVLQEEYESFINNPDNEIKEENILHLLYKYILEKGLKDDKQDGLLIKFINYYEDHKEELNYFINSEFEKEFALDSELKSLTKSKNCVKILLCN